MVNMGDKSGEVFQNGVDSAENRLDFAAGNHVTSQIIGGSQCVFCRNLENSHLRHAKIGRKKGQVGKLLEKRTLLLLEL